MLRGLGRFERALRESHDTRENLVSRLRPHKRFGIGLMGIDEFLNGRFQLRHAPVGATPQLLVGQFREPSFDEIQPRPIRRREMDVKARPLGEPVADERRFVRAVVVHDDVHVE